MQRQVEIVYIKVQDPKNRKYSERMHKALTSQAESIRLLKKILKFWVN